MKKQKGKTVVGESKTNIDNYFEGIGNLSFFNKVLYSSGIFLAIALFISILVNFYLANTLVNRKPLIIRVDRSSGMAAPLDYQVVDAEGDEREPKEIHHFIKTFISSLYTYNKHTLKKNFDSSGLLCSAEALSSIQDIVVDERAEFLGKDVQGLVDFISSSIEETTPDIKVSIHFKKKVIPILRESILFEGSYKSILRLKTVPRSLDNFHGLKVIEYIEFKDSGGSN